MSRILQILFCILKYGFLAVLLLILLFLFLLLLALFIPARYHGFLKKNEETEDELLIKAWIHWLNPVLRIKLMFSQNQLTYSVRLFGIYLFGSDKKKKEKKNNNRRKRKSKKSRTIEKTSDETQNDTKEVTESLPEQEERSPLPEKMQADRDKEEAFQQETKKKGVFRKILEKISGFFRKLFHFPSWLKDRFYRFVSGVRELFRKRDLLTEFLQDEICRAAFQNGFSDLARILKHAKPRKLKGQLIFGTGDPESTGKILAFLAVWYPLYGRSLTLIPDFNEAKFIAELTFKGRVRMIVLLTRLLHLYFHKQSKGMRKKWKTMRQKMKENQA